MHNAAWCAVVAVAWLFATGCVVTPPIRASGAIGGAAGAIPTYDPSDELRVESVATTSEGRVVATPLAILSNRLARRWDVGVGWTADLVVTVDDEPSIVYGPTAEVIWFARIPKRSRGFDWRWGPMATTEILLDHSMSTETERGSGFGVGAGFVIESVMDASHTARMSASRGELAVGASVEGRLRQLDGETHGLLLLAITVRFPGLLGVHLPALPSAAGAP